MEQLLNMPKERKEALLNAALKEFTQRGFDQASTNEIAKKSGISKSLMFHYVKNKQELFMLVYDYFHQLIHQEYYLKLDLEQKDVFVRLRQSYLLQIQILQTYPDVLLIENLKGNTKSEVINSFLASKEDQASFNCQVDLFKHIDTSKFRENVNIEKAKKIILWSNQGLINELLADEEILDLTKTTQLLDEYLAELRKLFYVDEE
ncbi:TetR/AcrR family transcriptional regulator [Enterococcus sp. AZ103]|uniref:TetR/AcrR family transcriptional regulator n=1 Tax=Enterococcus sp. AZ103 TaxID=2774628 RepID=UPI003F1E976B